MLSPGSFPVLPRVLLCVVSRWGRAPGVWWDKVVCLQSESLLSPSDHLDMDVDTPFIQLCLLVIVPSSAGNGHTLFLLSPCLDKSCSFKPGPNNGEEHNPSLRFPPDMEDKPSSSFICLSDSSRWILPEVFMQLFEVNFLAIRLWRPNSCFDSSVMFCRGSLISLSLSPVDFPPSFKHNDEPLQSCETQFKLL